MLEQGKRAHYTGVEESESVSRQTVVGQVMERIKQLIASGQYGPGDRLPTEQALAERFGVGRSSIREAIKVFQYLGVVDAQAGKGTVVRDRANISVEAITWALLLGEQDLGDVFELREVIETCCFTRLAAALAREEVAALDVVSSLRQVVELMDTAAQSGDVWQVVETDYRFHGVIIDSAGNRLFAEIYSTLQSFMRQEIAASYRRMSSLNEVVVDHRDIVEQLAAASAVESRRRHARHFERTRGLLGMSGASVAGEDHDAL